VTRLSDLNERAEEEVATIVDLLCYHFMAEAKWEELPPTIRESITIAAKDIWRKGYAYAHSETTIRLRKTHPGFPPQR
jgi:hypothetical protein